MFASSDGDAHNTSIGGAGGSGGGMGQADEDDGDASDLDLDDPPDISLNAFLNRTSFNLHLDSSDDDTQNDSNNADSMDVPVDDADQNDEPERRTANDRSPVLTMCRFSNPGSVSACTCSRLHHIKWKSPQFAGATKCWFNAGITAFLHCLKKFPTIENIPLPPGGQPQTFIEKLKSYCHLSSTYVMNPIPGKF